MNFKNKIWNKKVLLVIVFVLLAFSVLFINVFASKRSSSSLKNVVSPEQFTYPVKIGTLLEEISLPDKLLVEFDHTENIDLGSSDTNYLFYDMNELVPKAVNG